MRALLSLALLACSLAVAAADPDPQPEPDPQPQPDQPAQPVKDPAVAKKWLAAAQQLVQRGDALAKSKPDDAKAQYQNAVTAFTKAIEAGDDVSVYLQLGALDEKLGDVPAAIKAYQVIIKPDAGAKPDVVKKAQAKIDPLMAKVGTMTLVIQPDDTQITIDDKDYGKSPLKEPILLLPGTYKLSLSSDGYQPKTDIELKIEAGSESERKLELEPIAIKPTPPVTTTTPDQPAVKPGPPDKLPLYIGAGATGALAIGMIVTGVLAVHQHSIFTAPATAEPDRLDAQDNGHHLAIASDVLLVGSVAAAGFTAYWYLYKYKKQLDKPTDGTLNPNAPKLDFIPWVQPDGGGLAAIGSF